MSAETQKPSIDIRVGDEWVFATNSGGISRNVTAIEDGKVFYRGYGNPYEKECSVATFRRWARGASLEFAKDWTGRAAQGGVK